MASPHEMELLARQINQAHRMAVQAEMAAAGLSEVGHPMLLTILQSSSGAEGEGQFSAQRDLAELLHISPAAVANSLKSLEKGGYIRRKPSQGDARRNLVTLTEKGAAAVKECDRVFERVSTRMLEGFSEEEQDQLLVFRQRMLDNLIKKDHSSCKQEG